MISAIQITNEIFYNTKQKWKLLSARFGASRNCKTLLSMSCFCLVVAFVYLTAVKAHGNKSSKIVLISYKPQDP